MILSEQDKEEQAPVIAEQVDKSPNKQSSTSTIEEEINDNINDAVKKDQINTQEESMKEELT